MSYEGALNPAYARLAEHYGTAVVPARVRKPRDKPVVEGSVRFVAGQVAAVLRNRRFVGLAELNEAIFDQVAEINTKTVPEAGGLKADRLRTGREARC